jgi:sigma-E factor negative regulatory protein RseC
MERTGLITSIHAESMDITLQTAAHCASCASRSSCHGDSASTITVPLRAGVTIGQSVALSMAETTLTQSALLAYLLPPVCLLVGAGVGDSLAHTNPAAMGGALVGLASGFLLLRLLSRLFRHEQLQPKIFLCSQTLDTPSRSPAP